MATAGPYVIAGKTVAATRSDVVAGKAMAHAATNVSPRKAKAVARPQAVACKTVAAARGQVVTGKAVADTAYRHGCDHGWMAPAVLAGKSRHRQEGNQGSEQSDACNNGALAP